MNEISGFSKLLIGLTLVSMLALLVLMLIEPKVSPMFFVSIVALGFQVIIAE